MANNIVFNAKGLIKDLEALQPGLKKQLVRDAKLVSRPAISAIKSGIPKVNPFISTVRPVSNTHGRLGWGVGVKADTVKPSVKFTRSNRTAITSLASVVVSSPATALADVAGKGSGEVRRPVTDSYAYKGGMRKHRTTTQGQKMIKHLRSKRGNNFVYPAVEASLPSVEREVKLVFERYAAKVNRKLN